MSVTCAHEWYVDTEQDAAMTTGSNEDQHFTCALCGEDRVQNPPIAVQAVEWLVEPVTQPDDGAWPHAWLRS